MSLGNINIPLTDYAGAYYGSDNEACGNVPISSDVTTLRDLSGLFPNLTQTTGTKPVWKAAFNGGVLRFNNTTDNLLNFMDLFPSIPQPFTICHIARRRGLSAVDNARLYDVTTNVVRFEVATGGGLTVSRIFAGNTLGAVFAPTGVTGYINTFNGVNSEIMSGGVVRASGNAGTNAFSGTGFQAFIINGSAGFEWGETSNNADFYELQIFPRLFSADEKDVMTHYQQARIDVINNEM